MILKFRGQLQDVGYWRDSDEPSDKWISLEFSGIDDDTYSRLSKLDGSVIESLGFPHMKITLEGLPEIAVVE